MLSQKKTLWIAWKKQETMFTTSNVTCPSSHKNYIMWYSDHAYIIEIRIYRKLYVQASTTAFRFNLVYTICEFMGRV